MNLSTKNNLYIGIDVSAYFFHATLINEKSTLQQFEEISSDSNEIKHWVKELPKSKATITVCMEHTGVYSLQIAKVLHQMGMRIFIVPPQLLKRISSVRKAKTDLLDSAALADYVKRYHDTLREWTPKVDELQCLERLLTNREFFVNHKVSLKNKFRSEKYFENNEVILELLEQEIENSKATIKQIELQINELIELNDSMKSFAELAKSVPGVGVTLACELMNETEMLQSCASPKQLRSYLGIAPIVHQSGTSIRMRASSTGHGPNRMRRLLHLAARTVITHYPEFREYYHKKLALGKPKMLVLNNVANKIINILWAVLSKQTPYMPGYRSIEPRLIG